MHAYILCTGQIVGSAVFFSEYEGEAMAKSCSCSMFMWESMLAQAVKWA